MNVLFKFSLIQGLVINLIIKTRIESNSCTEIWITGPILRETKYQISKVNCKMIGSTQSKFFISL